MQKDRDLQTLNEKLTKLPTRSLNLKAELEVLWQKSTGKQKKGQLACEKTETSKPSTKNSPNCQGKQGHS